MSRQCIGNISPKTEIERQKTQIVKVFKSCGLSITINCNLKSVDFLDVMFDLVNDIYKPYHKPSNKPLYITKHSNQPRNILKQLQKSIEKLISQHQRTIMKTRNVKENGT